MGRYGNEVSQKLSCETAAAPELFLQHRNRTESAAFGDAVESMAAGKTWRRPEHKRLRA